jgi:FkbM family methyltransferase
MKPSGFLFRRLANLVPCVLPGVGSGQLTVSNKWQLNSLRDVFLSAHYWRIFEHINTPPGLVVDLGAHCGHFVVLAHLVSLEKFGRDDAQYIAVEPMEEMVDSLRQTLAGADLENRVKVVQALVGRPAGKAQMHTGRKNRLDSTVAMVRPEMVARGGSAAYVNVDDIVPELPIDLLKIDIEGSEYDLLRNHASFLSRAQLLVIELHEVAGESCDDFEVALGRLGFNACSRPIHGNQGTRQLLFTRSRTADTEADTGRRSSELG